MNSIKSTVLKRRDFIKAIGVGTAALAFSSCSDRKREDSTAGVIEQRNVLFISIDDLNDWIEPLGGHPQAKTPHH